MKKIKILPILLLILIPFFLCAQNLTQTIRGTVKDATSGEPLIGAAIQILDLQTTIGTITDVNGIFLLANIPVGQRTLEISYIGYETFAKNDVLNSAKEWNLDIELNPQIETFDVVIITPPKEPLNQTLVVSSRLISPEESERFPTSANDPGRMALSFPGVQLSKDNENAIVVRGNNSIGLLWRLEGVDIPNPNHFARIGSNGGGITVFSASILGESDFSSGGFSAEYGDVFSGVFDMNFRKGNTENREYTIRAGMLGLDISTEGPFKNKSGSYLFNYRYSTLGILNDLGLHLVGERVDNTFQDLSFSIFLKQKKQQVQNKIWGIGGLSKETESIKDLEDWIAIGDSTSREVQSDMGVLGWTQNRYFKNQSSLKTTLALSGQNLVKKNNIHNRENETQLINDQHFTTNGLTLHSIYKTQLSKKIQLKTGLQASLKWHDIQYDSLRVSDGSKRILMDEKSQINMVQPHAQLIWKFNARWTFNGGFHAQYYDLNEDFSLDPRLSVIHRLTEKQTLTLAMGRYTKNIPIGTHFVIINDQQPNRNLASIIAHHFILSYNHVFEKGFQFRTELYFQGLKDVPVGTQNEQTFSYINVVEGFVTEPLHNLGKGRNYGLDISLEKYFRNQLFFLLNASIIESKYKAYNGNWYNTQFNSKLAASFTGGKEWKIKNANFFQLGWKGLLNIGQASTPLIDETIKEDETPYDWSQAYADNAPTYYRIDIRLAFRKNKPNSSFLLALDLQNVTNRINKRPFGWNFSKENEIWQRSNQAGLIPILSFKIDF
ncbi:carboxypeptidase-like regulatory domain-containing protein [Saprospiraceae bacterium]|nr:carboxypeptidase-like regulatory domain-containing protein [Bacteroidota bacterium]MDB4727724.1 carboxypeptidase-like regulatory domain-containing protein [Saprospiraceae bacterium]